MRVNFLLGPAGSGKTFRCLAEIRAALRKDPDGPPLLLIAPKQATYQLERQLLADKTIKGYTRLQILSFERLAEFVLEQSGKPALRLLSEQGRLMVLRALLAKKHFALKIFHGSARLTGFAQQHNEVLSELQRHQLTPEKLRELAGKFQENEGLSFKLHDFATMLEAYLRWLNEHDLRDADCLMDVATKELSKSAIGNRQSAMLWLDGFTEMSPQELDFLAALVPHCEQATLTFCLDRIPTEKISWLSNWSNIRRTFDECQSRLKDLPDCEIHRELLKRDPDKSCFENETLRTLEKSWSEDRFTIHNSQFTPESLRLAKCATPESEATLAAHEILTHVRNGGRFRDATVLVRKLQNHRAVLERVFTRYEIPFFLDRRESVAHHPLAELTRSVLRIAALGWAHEDFFAALKSGLVQIDELEIDRLENEALARGWDGSAWQNELVIPNEPEASQWAESLRKKIVPAFQKLELKLLREKPTGKQLAAALREFWRELDVEEQLKSWAASLASNPEFQISNSVHGTIWGEMEEWLKNLELGFEADALSLRDWLPIVEAGLGSFTVGVIPPALDQVVIGSIDRSRNPDVTLAIVLGLNETIFPSPPRPGALLSESDRAELAAQNISLSLTARQQLGRERFYAYTAFTRARERLVLTCAAADSSGKTLSPSPFLTQLQRIFPGIEIENFSDEVVWKNSRHASELIPALLKEQRSSNSSWRKFVSVPRLVSLMERMEGFSAQNGSAILSPELAERLYGPVFNASVSGLEKFSACPFQFFVHAGLRAEERKMFELDPREQGSFQHDVLKFFHLELAEQKKLWRDLTPEQANERIGKIARGMLANYRDGLLEANAESRFKARMMIESLQNFVETLVSWMRERYDFNPHQVEFAFGADDNPSWELPLSGGQKLALRGRIDRVDIFKTGEDEALCVVMDYK